MAADAEEEGWLDMGKIGDGIPLCWLFSKLEDESLNWILLANTSLVVHDGLFVGKNGPRKLLC